MNDNRVVPKRLSDRYSIALIYDGELSEGAANQFTQSIEGWRKGETILYIPKSCQMVLTKRQRHPVRFLKAKIDQLKDFIRVRTAK